MPGLSMRTPSCIGWSFTSSGSKPRRRASRPGDLPAEDGLRWWWCARLARPVRAGRVLNPTSQRPSEICATSCESVAGSLAVTDAVPLRAFCDHLAHVDTDRLRSATTQPRPGTADAVDRPVAHDRDASAR